MTTYKMPDRQSADGAVNIKRVDGKLMVAAEGDGSLLVSEFNAWRIFGMLSLFLGLPLSKAVGKAIKLSAPGEKLPDIIVSRDLGPNPSLGARVAAHLADEVMQAKLAEQGIEMVKVERAGPNARPDFFLSERWFENGGEGGPKAGPSSRKAGDCSHGYTSDACTACAWERDQAKLVALSNVARRMRMRMAVEPDHLTISKAEILEWAERLDPETPFTSDPVRKP